jgi:DNA-binding transcriptional MerR regulator/methylmalonyl-CoA mutase cobalamin-binding subunit
LYAADVTAHLRIGELARRTGVSPALLRAWERRYALLEPERTSGGFRLYTDDDVRRIRAMSEHLSRGLSAAEAARLARADGGTAPTGAAALLDALLAFDETGAHAALDRALAELGRETVLAEVLGALRRIGDGWQREEVTVAQEHFATTVLRGRLLGLARGWDRGTGPRALLAAPPGELHDLGLIVFGLALREHGWRITLLGADTPLATLAEAARRLSPSVVVVAALAPDRLEPVTGDLARLGEVAPVVLAGAGASRGLAVAAGAGLLPDDPFEAAAQLASSA